jgi:tetratricopeptide (TPR) repeat protein
MPVFPQAFLFRALLGALLLAQGLPVLSPALAAQQPAEPGARETGTGGELKKSPAPKPPPEALRKQRLDELFARLHDAQTPAEAQQIALSIERLWLQTPSVTASLLMQRAAASIDAQKFPLALELLDKLVLLEPDWAEAWNERATVKFMAGDLDGAMADFTKTIRLEPRHFGALTGMGLVLEREGFDDRAREVFLKVRTIYPLAPDIQKPLDKPVPDEGSKDI